MSEYFDDEIKTNNFLIYSQFELLKYIGGKDKDGSASGEGVPIDIVLLPDIVLDIRQYNLDNSDNNQKCIAIGGRSGRVACILGHLIDIYDGSYRPHIVAKTGNLGKLLLENEFYNKENLNDSRKLISHIVEREGEPRVTVWTDSRSIYKSRKAFTENEINTNDLQNEEFLKDTINKCRIIYFSSIKSPNFENVLNFLTNELKNKNAKIYIDCTRSEINHLINLKTIISDKNFNTNNIEGIILSSDEINTLKTCWRTFKKDLQEKHIGLLSYSNSKIEYFDKEGELTIEIETQIDFDNEDIPERFKAGFLLASSIYETAKYISSEITSEQIIFVQQFQNIFEDFWKDNPMLKMINFGISIAMAKSNKLGYCDLESVFGGQEDVFPSNVESLNFRTKNLTDFSKHIDFDDTDIRKLVRLSGYRRKGILKLIENPGRIHFDCPNLKNCKYVESQGVNEQDAFFNTIVMIDLDGTLLDSSIARNNGLKSALKIINSELNIVNESIDFFQKNVYNNWPLFKALDKGDFRQQWNLRGWYITYILFSKNPTLLTRIKVDLARITKPEKNPLGLANLIKQANWTKELLKLYVQIETENADTIDKAVQKFNGIKLFAFKEAFDFLKSLQDSGIYNLYVVSEGNPETQWLKLKSTGLSEFFPRVKVLTTDDAGNFNRQIEFLKQEKQIILNKINDTTSDEKGITNSFLEFANFKLLLGIELDRLSPEEDPADSEIGSVIKKIWVDAYKFERSHFARRIAQIKRNLELYEERQKTIQFVETLLQRLSTKGGITFYAAVIRAILNNPEAPLDSLKDFEKLIDFDLPDTPFKIAMIGDRQKNDIEPIIKLLGRKKMLTLRLLSGKYYNTEPINNNLLDPDYIVHTLAQAKALLLSEDIWANKICTYETPFFCLKIEIDEYKRKEIPSENNLLNPESVSVSVGLDIILTGIQMPSIIFPLTNKICRKILKEFILLNPDVGLKPIFERIGLFAPLVEDRRELIRKTRLLTSLINDTNLQHKDLIEHLDSLRMRLTDTELFIKKLGFDSNQLHHIESALKLIENDPSRQS
jgi:FMN phosphatase YigB (HAD superfamily)